MFEILCEIGVVALIYTLVGAFWIVLYKTLKD